MRARASPSALSLSASFRANSGQWEGSSRAGRRPRRRERASGLLAKLALGIATKQDPEFYALSSVARAAELYAAALKGADKGGVRQNIPFRLFFLYLAVAFQSATDQKAKVTWDDIKGCYKGRFVNFVEAVLSLTKDWPERLDVTFSYPSTPRKRGKYIYELTRAGARKRKTAR